MEAGFGRLDHAVIVRDALPGELAEVGDIRLAAYQAGGHMSPDSGYAPVLRALGSEGDGTVLVAVAGPGGGPLLGTVMLQYWPDGGQVGVGRDEAEIRALAVAPEGQGQGTGRALLHAAIERAERAGVTNLVLLTQPDMRAAQHLYQQAGFRRLPDRDWSPRPGVTLLAYGLPLPASR
jgi:ribosomal protein S18 acetylase RimI-like enzyme